MNIEWIGLRKKKREEFIHCQALTSKNEPCKARATWKVDEKTYCVTHKKKIISQGEAT